MYALLCCLVASSLAPSSYLSSIRPSTQLPETGIDFTGLDHFWRIVDTLSAGLTPTEGQWDDLLDTPGYDLATRFVRGVRHDMEIAFLPNNSAVYDRLVERGGDQASRLRHLRRAISLRVPLTSLQDSLARTLRLDEAIRNASAFLPPGAIDRRDAPLVALAIFRYDGYASPSGTVVDLLYVHDNGLIPLLSHEFHHIYAGEFNETSFPESGAADAALVRAFFALRNEGIADLVDKSHPLVPTSAGMERYATRYNMEYARTMQVLEQFDSVLAAVHAAPDQIEDAGRFARSLFWSNGHAHGAYMARTIDETLGRESVWEALRSPFRFLENFREAVRRKDGGTLFSPEALVLLKELKERYDGP